MNLVALAPVWLIAVLACALASAAIEDALRLRISNITSLAVLVGAIIAGAMNSSWALWQNLAVFAAILLLGFVAFAAGWLGGGDVKLFAATGLWFDMRSAVWFVALVFLSGGLVAILYLLTRPFRRRKSKKDGRIPYGIAIAVGALVVISIHRASHASEPRLPSMSIVPQQR